MKLMDIIKIFQLFSENNKQKINNKALSCRKAWLIKFTFEIEDL